jgi:hypothetical protein
MHLSARKIEVLKRTIITLIILVAGLLVVGVLAHPTSALALEKKAIIIGNDREHENTVKNNFVEWAPNDWQVDRAMDISRISDPTNLYQ